MRCDAIKIWYPGDCISVNHYLGRRRDGGVYVKQETKDWKEEFQWLLKCCHLEDYRLPLHVTCSGYFKDARSQADLSNLSKVILDSIEELIGVNDSNYRWHDGDLHFGYKDPYLLITLEETPETSPDALQLKSTPLKGRSRSKP